MNNEFNNYNQINRVVTPIKVNEVGNIVSNKSDIEINVKKKKNSSNILFILLLSIILIIILYILTNYIIPSYNESVNNEVHYNDNNNVVDNINYEEIKSFTLNDGNIINSDGVLNVNNDFLINISNGILYINNNEISKISALYPNVGIVKDNLIFGIKKDNDLSITLLGINKNGDKVLEFNNIEGYYLMDDITAIQFNLYSVNILTTNVFKDSLYLNNNYYNICNELPDRVDDSFVVLRRLSITYSDNKFNSPSNYNSIDLKTYKKVNNYCN